MRCNIHCCLYMKIANYICSLRPEILFIVISLFFGTISAILVPQLSVNDENAHFYRSYSLTEGNFLGKNCHYPKETIRKIVDSEKRIYSFDISQKNSDYTTKHICGSAGGYYPFMHLPQGVGIIMGKVIYDSPTLMVLLGRLTNLLFFTGSMYLIIKYVRIGKWVFFAIGLLPIMIHTAASLSYDTFNAVAILAFIAIIINLFGQKKPLSKKQLVTLVAVALLMALSKFTNIVLLLLLVVLPSSLFSQQLWIAKKALLNKILLIIGILFVSIMAAYIWPIISGSTVSDANAQGRLNDNPLYMLVILYNTYINPFLGYTDIVMRGTVGEFSSFQYHLPIFLVTTSFALIGFTLFAENKSEDRYFNNKVRTLSIMSCAVLAVSLLLITYALYTKWAALPWRLGPNAIYADGVQGRYFTPLLALLIPVGVWLRRYVCIKVKTPQIRQGIIVLTSLFLLTFYTLETALFLNN